MESKIFPVSFQDFREETNVREIATNSLPKTMAFQGKQFKATLRLYEHSVYVAYFQDSNGRAQSPQKHVKVNANCSEEKRALYHQYIRYPISFEEFKAYTNILEIAESQVNQRGKCENRETKIEQLAMRMFQNYYTLPETRNGARILFKPCPAAIQQKLMEFASFHAPTKEHTAIPADVNTLEPTTKRKRTLSDEIDSTTENTPEEELMPCLNPKPQSQPIVERDSNPENAQVPKFESLFVLKSAPISEEFLGKYIDAYLQRKREEILKKVKVIVEENSTQRCLKLTKSEECLTLKRKRFMKILPNSKKKESPLDSLQKFFETNDKFHRLSQNQYNNNELCNQIISSIYLMNLEEFRYYTRIHGAPVDIYNNMDILKRLHAFVMVNPKVWPLNLYISLKDLFSFLKTKDISYPNENLKHITPKILMWNDLLTLTNFDKCVFAESPGCRRHLNKKRQLYYNVCWAHDRWIEPSPKITDPIMIKLMGIAHSNIAPNIKTEPVPPALLNGMEFQLRANENDFDIMEMHESVLSIVDDTTVTPTDVQNDENKTRAEKSISEGTVYTVPAGVNVNIESYHQGKNRFMISNENEATILEKKKIFFCALVKFYFFEKLSAAQIVQYNLSTNGLGKRFAEAFIDCNEKVFIHSLNFFEFFLKPLKWISPTLLRDLETVLRDINEYYYYKHKVNFRKNPSHNSQDIRNKVLSFFFSVLPNFCACNLIYHNILTNSAICSFEEHNLSKSVCLKLPSYVQPSILKKIKSLHTKMY